jgi:hypothetical protein
MECFTEAFFLVLVTDNFMQLSLNSLIPYALTNYKVCAICVFKTKSIDSLILRISNPMQTKLPQVFGEFSFRRIMMYNTESRSSLGGSNLFED